MNIPYRRYQYIYELLHHEGKFVQHGVAYDDVTGLTFDGFPLDPFTGELSGFARSWSSPTKEALHLHILSLGLSGNTLARHFLKSTTSNLNETIIYLLEKKLIAYTEFEHSYPGFGGFLPWFVISEGKLRPAQDWINRVPALDNGMYFWSIYQTMNVLKEYVRNVEVNHIILTPKLTLL